MCLVYTPIPLDDLPETFTAYKVYKRTEHGGLRSPHFGTYALGSMYGGSTLRNPQVPTCCYAAEPKNNGRWKDRQTCVAPIPLHDCLSGWEMDIPGFHVIAKREDAELYRKHLEENALDSTPGAYVVVPVQVNKADIYATGHTPFGSPRGYLSERPMYSVVTYVTRQICVTPKDYADQFPTSEFRTA